MKKHLFLSLFMALFSSIQAQQSLDSLRMVLPVGHTDWIRSANFSPDGKLLITGSTDMTARIYDVESAKEIQMFKDTGIIELAKFSPDGKLAVTSSDMTLDYTIRVWDIETGKSISSLNGMLGPNFDISSDGRKILTSNGKDIVLWDFRRNKQTKLPLPNFNLKDIFKYGLERESVRFEFSIDGRYILAYITKNGGWTHKKLTFIRVWDANSGKKINDFNGHSNWLLDAHFNGLGTSIISSSEDSTIRLWDIATGKEIWKFETKNYFISDVDFTKDDNSIIVTANEGKEGKILFYDVKTGLKSQINFLSNLISSNTSADGKFLITREYYRGSCYLIDLSTNKIEKMDLGTVFCSSPNSQNLALSGGSSVYLYNIEDKKIIKHYTGHTPGDFDGFDTHINSIKEKKMALTLDISGKTAATETFVYNEYPSGLSQRFIDTVENQGFIPLMNKNNFSSNGDMVILACEDNSAKIFNLNTGELVHNLKGHKNAIRSAAFSKDSRSAITTSLDGTAVIWDVESGQMTQVLNHDYFSDAGEWISPSVVGIALSPDRKYAITLSNEGFSEKGWKYHLWWLEFGIEVQTINTVETFSDFCDDLRFFNSNGKIIISDTNYVPRIYQITTEGNFLSEIYNPLNASKGNPVFNLDGSRIGKRGIMGNKYEILDVLSLNTFVLPWKRKYHRYDGFDNNINFSIDSEKFILARGQVDDYSAFVYNSIKGDKISELKDVHSQYVTDASFCSDGNHVWTIGADHKIVLWDAITGNPIYERIQLENNNWLVKLPNSPYYMCSKDASKMLHYVTPSLKVIGFEQLDPVYNRPDIVLDSIGKYFDNEDQGKIEEYRKAWEKRIEYLGLDKNMLGKGEISVPQAELQVAEETISNDGKIQVNVVASDPKYALKRFNVFVNEVPLYGSSGVSIAHMNKQNWDTTLSVPLSIGDNKIQVSVMNELGLESFKYPSYVSYAPKMEQSIKGKTYFIGIGVDKFRDTCFNLNYCVKDVTDLSKAFGKGQGNTETILLTNKMVTRENILKLKSTLQKTTVNDKVIISCNSHGLLDEKKRFYLATHDIDFEHPSERGISYQELESLLDSIPARQKLLLLDACNSGENEIGQELVLANKPKTKCEQEVGGRSVGRANVKKNNEDFMKMNELFVNVRNNTGSVIISAAGGQQSALEGEGVQVDGKGISNGAFTYCVLEYLKQHEGDAKALTVVQLKQYVEKRVEEITKGQQKPTSRQETMEIDWGLR